MQILDSLVTQAASISAVRRDIHAHPELAFEENRTAGVVAKELAASGSVDAVVALGAVIRGDTPHFEYVSGEAASGLQRAAMDTGVHVAFGVLTVNTMEQALDRCGDSDNKGEEAAVGAIMTARVLRTIHGR